MDCDSVRDQVNRILRSASFAGKTQLVKLLQILFQNMDSQTSLKPERVIKELWPDEAKTKRSTDLATEISRLRKAIETYYKLEGENDPITISLPNRSVPAPNGVRELRWILAEPRSPIVESTVPAIRTARSRAGLKIIATMSIVAVLAYLAIRMFTADERPQIVRLDDETLTVMNAEGKELWHKSFPEGLWQAYYDEALGPRTWIGDLDGKGHVDVLFLYHPANSPMSHSSTLICYSDQGQEKWRWTPGRVLPELEGNPTTFNIVGLAVLKATQGAKRQIVVSSHNEPYYPHQIAIVDSDGKTLSEYWHSGHLDHLALADLDGSGREVIIATGISNGYNQATLVELDPNRVHGASTEAARPELQLHSMGAADERFRLLFPRSDLNKDLQIYNEALGVTIDHGRIRVLVRECSHIPRCFILYEFDNDYHLHSVVPDDQFKSAHKEFYINSKRDHPFSAGEQNDLIKVQCLVGCKTEFVSSQIP